MPLEQIVEPSNTEEANDAGMINQAPR